MLSIRLSFVGKVGGAQIEKATCYGGLSFLRET